MAFYVLDENNNKVEALDKEGVLAVLAQAIADGSLENVTADAAFISKVKCCVCGDTKQMAFITQAKYNELLAASGLQENTYYFIIDDTSYEDIDKALEEINAAIASTDKSIIEITNTLTYIEKKTKINTADITIEANENGALVASNVTDGDIYDITIVHEGNQKTIRYVCGYATTAKELVNVSVTFSSQYTLTFIKLVRSGNNIRAYIQTELPLQSQYLYSAGTVKDVYKITK